jgi:hypothetical protein
MQGNDLRANGKTKIFLTSDGNRSELENPVRKKANINNVRLNVLVSEGVFRYHIAIPIIAIIYELESLAVLNNTTNRRMEARAINLKLCERYCLIRK